MEFAQKGVEKRLYDLRKECLDKRRSIEESRFSLHLQAIEAEERAAAQQFASELEMLDLQHIRRIGAIEYALNRLRVGEYHLCEVCSEDIARGRLLALPWTTTCISCADKRS